MGERLQTNWYIEKSMIDTARYADVFVWPFMYIKKEPAITDSGAKEFIGLIYGTYDKGFHLDLFGIMIFFTCVICAAICFKFDTGKGLGRRSANTQAETVV